jgi:SOS-response transcriptional repressor LexA
LSSTNDLLGEKMKRLKKPLLSTNKTTKGNSAKMSSLKARIAELFSDQPDKKAAHLAKYLKISRSSVSSWMTGQTKTIAGDNAFGVAKFFGCNAEWVQSGKGRKYPERQQKTNEFSHDSIQFIPHIHWHQVFSWSVNMKAVSKAAIEWLPCPTASCGPRTYALTISDDSMTNPYPGQRSYPSGTVIYVDPDKPLKPGCRVVATIADDVVFREYRKDGGKLILKPLNPQYLPHEIDGTVQISGVVVGQYLAE